MDEKPQFNQKINLGTSRIPELRMANFPNADEIVRKGLLETPAFPGCRGYHAGESTHTGWRVLDPHPASGWPPDA